MKFRYVMPDFGNAAMYEMSFMQLRGTSCLPRITCEDWRAIYQSAADPQRLSTVRRPYRTTARQSQCSSYFDVINRVGH